MKIRLLSKHADGIGLLYKLWKEGNDVDFWVAEKKARPTYKGILPQVSTYSSGLKKNDIVLFDMVGLGFLADKLKRSGMKVFGGGRINDRLELDRGYGLEVASRAMEVPIYEKFVNKEQAVNFLKNKKGCWVYKPLNNKSPMQTYLGQDKDDLIYMLDYYKSKDFILQEKIDGTEISTEAWYVNGKLVPNSINSTIETKKFMDDDKGPNTGCMTSVVRFGKGLYEKTHKGLKNFLRQKKYTGPLDINCIVKDGKAYFLEFTTRFGYNAIYACLSEYGEFGKFISDMAQGNIPKIKPSGQYCGAIRISIPPYPNDVDASKTAGQPIRGIESLDDVILLDAKYDDRLLTAGVDGVVCEVTHKAKTLDLLEKEIYKKVSKIKIPNMQYRSDGVRLAKQRFRGLGDTIQ